MLVKHRPRPPTQKDWTALRNAQAWEAFLWLAHQMLERGALTAIKVQIAERKARVGQDMVVQAADFGARDDSYSKAHHARLNKTDEHLSDQLAKATSLIMLVISKSPHSFLYDLLCESNSKMAVAMLDVNQNKIGVV